MIRKHFRFKRLILGLTVGFAIAAVTAPAVPAMHGDKATGGAQASSEKYGTLDPWAYNVINRSAQATVAPAGKYSQLDPWAYNVIHRSAQTNVAPAGKYSQLDPWAYNVINRSTKANGVSGGKYGQLDPWAYTVIHRSSPTVVTARPDNGFNWSDAGIGASFVFGGALVLLTAVALGRRYRSRFDRSGLATS
jgi:hypothetical protein